MVEYSWLLLLLLGDCIIIVFVSVEFVEGESSPPAGKSERAASIRRILTERAGLKLWDLLVVLEKMLDELERMRYTKA